MAERVLTDHGLRIPAVGLAKRLEEVYLPGQPQPLTIPRGSESLFLLQHLRDEAHRFAITYHRGKRAKRAGGGLQPHPSRNTGLRFSMKAVMPSIRSSVAIASSYSRRS